MLGVKPLRVSLRWSAGNYLAVNTESRKSGVTEKTVQITLTVFLTLLFLHTAGWVLHNVIYIVCRLVFVVPGKCRVMLPGTQIGLTACITHVLCCLRCFMLLVHNNLFIFQFDLSEFVFSSAYEITVNFWMFKIWKFEVWEM